MKWIIQSNLFLENGISEMIETLDRFDIPYQLTAVTADNRLNPEIDGIDNLAIGSILLSNIAAERGWIPGSFLNQNFDLEKQMQYMSSHMLNGDGIIDSLKNISPVGLKFFIRPILDTKSFNGQLMTAEHFESWRNNIDPNVKVLISTPKIIGQEYRFYVVDKEVITGSRYKLAGKVNYSDQIDRYIIEKAQEFVNIWQPARAFVIDLAITDTDISIVEYGNINNCGLYRANIPKLVMALNDMKF